jgi:hypothetical protein
MVYITAEFDFRAGSLDRSNTLETDAERLGDSRDAWGLNRRRDPSAGVGVIS